MLQCTGARKGSGQAQCLAQVPGSVVASSQCKPWDLSHRQESSGLPSQPQGARTQPGSAPTWRT